LIAVLIVSLPWTQGLAGKIEIGLLIISFFPKLGSYLLNRLNNIIPQRKFDKGQSA